MVSEGLVLQGYVLAHLAQYRLAYICSLRVSHKVISVDQGTIGAARMLLPSA